MSSSRRTFLQSTAAAGLGLAATGLANAATPQKISPNDKIRVATIGIGGMGTGDTESALSNPGVELAAVADVYQGRLDRAKERWGAHLFTTRDYREILARKDIDAVYIATPDHWHARIAVDALKAGKDTYIQKPMVQDVREGWDVINAAKSSGKIVQVGSQRVSSIAYEKARQLFDGGSIGNLNLVEAWWDRNSAIGAWQYSIPPDATPANIDWDRFLGSAPKVPFEPVRLFRWRNYQDYGTGVAGDLFVHLFSGIHYVLNSLGPVRIYSTGGLRYWKDGRDVPDVMLGLFDYPETKTHPAFTLTLKVNFVSGAGEDSGFRFTGSEGRMEIAGNSVIITKTPRETEPGYTIGTFPEKVQEQFLEQYRKEHPRTDVQADSMRPAEVARYSAPRGYSDQRHHHENFIAAVRSRKQVVEDAVFGFRAAGPALLCNQSFFQQKVLHWNPETMKVAGKA
jgi:predicted dehydrogenase